jgi:thiamine kinase-like enzyme
MPDEVDSISQNSQFIHPPVYIPEVQQGNWFEIALPEDLISFVTSQVDNALNSSKSWHVCRLSYTTYFYQEVSSGWGFVAKYYTHKVKVPSDEVLTNSTNEYNRILQAIHYNFETPELKVIKPLYLWKGALILEYSPGLTVADLIATRRNQPGKLSEALKLTGKLLARLHNASKQQTSIPIVENVRLYTHTVIDDLVAKSVLKRDKILTAEIRTLVDNWCRSPIMHNFSPAFAHGDPTTGNFIFQNDGRIVGIDWERAYVGDPASDLGILNGEIGFNFLRNTTLPGEIESFVDCLTQAYLNEIDTTWDATPLLKRSKYYEAMSILRIARSSSLSDTIRWQLIAQALGKLSIF